MPRLVVPCEVCGNPVPEALRNPQADVQFCQAHNIWHHCQFCGELYNEPEVHAAYGCGHEDPVECTCDRTQFCCMKCAGL